VLAFAINCLSSASSLKFNLILGICSNDLSYEILPSVSFSSGFSPSNDEFLRLPLNEGDIGGENRLSCVYYIFLNSTF